MRHHKECKDPIWGRPYFLNKWNSEVVYRLDQMPRMPFIRMVVEFSMTNVKPHYFMHNVRGGRELAIQRIHRIKEKNYT